MPYNVVPLALLRRIAAALRIGTGSHFADLACGTGGPSLWVAQETGARVTGVDYSDAAINAAVDLAQRRGAADAVFLCADATETGLEDDSVDAVMMLDALQFLPPGDAAREVARILKPGGCAAFTTWEVIGDDLPIPSMVREYEPVFAGAGMRVSEHEILDDFAALRREFFQALLTRADALLAEMGPAAQGLIEEARAAVAAAGQPPRVKRVYLLVQR